MKQHPPRENTLRRLPASAPSRSRRQRAPAPRSHAPKIAVGSALFVLALFAGLAVADITLDLPSVLPVDQVVVSNDSCEDSRTPNAPEVYSVDAAGDKSSIWCSDNEDVRNFIEDVDLGIVWAATNPSSIVFGEGAPLEFNLVARLPVTLTAQDFKGVPVPITPVSDVAPGDDDDPDAVPDNLYWTPFGVPITLTLDYTPTEAGQVGANGIRLVATDPANALIFYTPFETSLNVLDQLTLVPAEENPTEVYLGRDYLFNATAASKILSEADVTVTLESVPGAPTQTATPNPEGVVASFEVNLADVATFTPTFSTEETESYGAASADGPEVKARDEARLVPIETAPELFLDTDYEIGVTVASTILDDAAATVALLDTGLETDPEDQTRAVTPDGADATFTVRFPGPGIVTPRYTVAANDYFHPNETLGASFTVIKDTLELIPADLPYEDGEIPLQTPIDFAVLVKSGHFTDKVVNVTLQGTGLETDPYNNTVIPTPEGVEVVFEDLVFEDLASFVPVYDADETDHYYPASQAALGVEVVKDTLTLRVDTPVLSPFVTDTFLVNVHLESRFFDDRMVSLNLSGLPGLPEESFIVRDVTPKRAGIDEAFELSYDEVLSFTPAASLEATDVFDAASLAGEEVDVIQDTLTLEVGVDDTAQLVGIPFDVTVHVASTHFSDRDVVVRLEGTQMAADPALTATPIPGTGIDVVFEDLLYDAQTRITPVAVVEETVEYAASSDAGPAIDVFPDIVTLTPDVANPISAFVNEEFHLIVDIERDLSGEPVTVRLLDDETVVDEQIVDLDDAGPFVGTADFAVTHPTAGSFHPIFAVEPTEAYGPASVADETIQINDVGVVTFLDVSDFVDQEMTVDYGVVFDDPMTGHVEFSFPDALVVDGVADSDNVTVDFVAATSVAKSFLVSGPAGVHRVEANLVRDGLNMGEQTNSIDVTSMRDAITLAVTVPADPVYVTEPFDVGVHLTSTFFSDKLVDVSILDGETVLATDLGVMPTTDAGVDATIGITRDTAGMFTPTASTALTAYYAAASFDGDPIEVIRDELDLFPVNDQPATVYLNQPFSTSVDLLAHRFLAKTFDVSLFDGDELLGTETAILEGGAARVTFADLSFNEVGSPALRFEVDSSLFEPVSAYAEPLTVASMPTFTEFRDANGFVGEAALLTYEASFGPEATGSVVFSFTGATVTVGGDVLTSPSAPFPITGGDRTIVLSVASLGAANVQIDAVLSGDYFVDRPDTATAHFVRDEVSLTTVASNPARVYVGTPFDLKVRATSVHYTTRSVQVSLTGIPGATVAPVSAVPTLGGVEVTFTTQVSSLNSFTPTFSVAAGQTYYGPATRAGSLIDVSDKLTLVPLAANPSLAYVNASFSLGVNVKSGNLTDRAVNVTLANTSLADQSVQRTPTPAGVEAAYTVQLAAPRTFRPIFRTVATSDFEAAQVEGAPVAVAFATPTTSFPGVSIAQGAQKNVTYTATFALPASGQVAFTFPAGLPVRDATGADRTGQTLTRTFTNAATFSETFRVNGTTVNKFAVRADLTSPSMQSLQRTTTNVTVSDTQAPSAPSALRVTSGANDATPAFAWTAATDNVAIANYLVYVDAKMVGLVTGTTFDATAALVNGAHVLKVQARDASANSGPNATLNFALDLADPTLESLTIEGQGADYTVRGVLSEAADVVFRYGVNTPPESSMTLPRGTTFTAALTNLTIDSVYHYVVEMTDAAGNSGESSGAFLTSEPVGGTLETVTRTAASAELFEAVKIIAPSVASTGLFLLDVDGDAQPDQVEAGSALEMVRSFPGESLFLARELSSGTLFLVDVARDVAETTAAVEASIQSRDEQADNDTSYVTVEIAQKTGWIQGYFADPYPDGAIVEVIRGDGTAIDTERVWKADGKVYFLDDPATEYTFKYDVNLHGAFAWLAFAVAVLLLAVLLSAAGYTYFRRLREGLPKDDATPGTGAAAPEAAAPPEAAPTLEPPPETPAPAA